MMGEAIKCSEGCPTQEEHAYVVKENSLELEAMSSHSYAYVADIGKCGISIP